MLMKPLIAMCTTCFLSFPIIAETLTIATVNNGHMAIMKELSDHFTQKNPNINVEWVTFDENILRQRVTTDVTTNSGKYDVMTIGNYEVPLWAKQGWLLPLNSLHSEYDINDLLPAVRNALTINNQLYAAPFYAESSMVIYRTDLLSKVGLTMPKEPTWEFIRKAAAAITDKKNDIYGICLRGKAGWGENIALLTSMAHSFGARWFNEHWEPQLNSQAWHDTLDYYVSLLQNYGPPGVSSNGFNENLSLFQAGKCGIWIDATVAGSFVSNPTHSNISDKVGFALAPNNGLNKRSNWLWAWALAVPSSTQYSEAAMKFVAWATSKEYLALVASKKGISKVPPGTRKSLYKNTEYMKSSPFAQITLASIQAANPSESTLNPRPYAGVQYVAIPEFQEIGTAVGRQLSAVLAGQMSVKDGLSRAQNSVRRLINKSNYPKK